MSTRFNRRDFLVKTAGIGGCAVFASSLYAGNPKKEKKAKGTKISTPSCRKIGWNIGCQLYTFRDRTFYEALDVIAGLGIRHVEPCFFLPLSKENPDLKTSEMLNADQRKELKKRLSDSGVKMTNYYAPIDGAKENFRKIFDFAKEMGVKNLVAEPPAEVFDELEKLCDEYEINLTIHNHPKGDNSHYWNPEAVLAVCKGRGKHIGGCVDTGHWVRSGIEPIECLKKMKGRILSLHLKDVAEWGKPEARDVPLGEGKAKYTEVLKELYAQKYKGLLTVEYEHLSDKLAEDVAKCVKFVEDFAKSLKG